MEEAVQKLWTLSKAERIQSVDCALGVELTNLYILLKDNPFSLPDNFEDLLLNLIVINKGQISITNSHLIALCCILYYKRQNPPNYWKLFPVLTEEIKKMRKPSIYILGLLSRRLCDGFKSQLPTSIQYLLKSDNEELFPLICQCFRRILKGTGTFLIQIIPEIFGFIFAGSSSTNELIRIESVKSIPTLLEYAHISIKKLLPIIGQLLHYTSKEMQFYTAKSLAKLIFFGAKIEANSDSKKSADNVVDSISRESDDKNKEAKESNESNFNHFKFCFKIILQFAQNDKNSETLALTINILLRFYQPIEIVKRLKTFTNFILCLPSMKLPAQSVVFLSNGVITAVTSVVGSTIGNSICYHIIGSFKKSDTDNRGEIESLANEQKALIALTALINFDASTKTVATAAKQLYPLLSSCRKNLQKVCTAFFAKLGQKEENLGKVFIDAFCSFLVTVDDNRINDVDGFSKAASAVIVSLKSNDLLNSCIEKVKSVISAFLVEKNYSSCKMAMSYLLLASLAKKRKGYDMIPFVFNFTQSYLKCLPRSKVDKFAKKTFKYISSYFLQIMLNPPNHLDKLISTIRGFILIILPNTGVLSKSGQFIFLKLTKIWFEYNSTEDKKVADFAVRLIVRLFQISFENESNIRSASNNSNSEDHICSFNKSTSSMASIDADLCSILSADIGNFLYNFETPSNNHISHIEICSLTDFFGIKTQSSNCEFCSDNDFFLSNLQFWALKCTPAVIKEVIPPLFEYAKLDMCQIVSKLKLLSSFLKSTRDLGLNKNFLNKLINLEHSIKINSNEQRLIQIQFAIAQTVSLWFISHSAFSDIKIVESSNLNILMNGKNVFFSSLLIAFTSKYLCDEIQVQALLFLMQNIQSDDNPVLMYSLRSLLSSFHLISDFSAQIGNFLENISYTNNLVSKPALIKEFTKCVLAIYDKISYIQSVRIIQNLLHFPTNFNFAQFAGLKITSELTKLMTPSEKIENDIHSILLNSLFDYQNEIDLTLQKPLPTLISAFSSSAVITPTLGEVPLLFMMLQQTSSGINSTPLNEDIINECILRVFNTDCNVKKWTNFAKRIVIIGCVPPAQRKGDIRILPTSSVLICAIKISVLLVSKIRETMELRCVDDIVSIAFTAIHMENRKIDFHCYSILSSVITCFEDVKNQDSSLLDVYFSQFHPTFCHAFDEGKRELQSVASFVIAFFNFVEKNKKNLLDEVSLILIDGLKRMKFTNENFIVFCRVASLVNKEDSEFDGLFIKSSSIFLKDVLLQKRSMSELKSELPKFVSKYQRIQKVYKSKHEFVPDRIILVLLLAEFKDNCDSTNLNAITNCECIVHDSDSVEFVLRTIINSNLLARESEEDERVRLEIQESEKRQAEIFSTINSDKIDLKNEEKEKSDDFGNADFDVVDDEDDFADNDIDQTSFWVFPLQSQSSVNRFLLKVTTDGQIGKLVEPVLTLSLSKPFCLGAICNVLKLSASANTKYAPLITKTVLGDEIGDDSLALFKFMFEYVSADVIDGIVSTVLSNEKISNENRFEILRYALSKLNGFEFNSIQNIVDFLRNPKVLLPDGINFVGSLLLSSKTALTAVFILHSGLLTAITAAMVSPDGMKILPRILQFFNIALKIVRKICSNENYRAFCVLASRVALVSLAQVADVKERAAVVKPACLLIRSIDAEIVKFVFDSGRLRKRAIASVTPQKQAKTIQLLTFADVSNRKSNTGWQTLEIDSDED